MVWLIHLLGGCPGSWKQHRCFQICSWTMGLLTAVWFCQTYHQRANSFVYWKGISLPPTLKLGSRNIWNCARVRTLDRLFPFWEGEKKTSEICESNACSSWLRPQTEPDWLKPPESHAKVSRQSDPWRRSQNGQLLLAMRQWKKDSGENNLPKAPLLRVMLNNSFGLVICASTPSGKHQT